MTTKCQLTDDLIAWYVHKQRLDPCLSLIKKNVYVDNWHVKNMILGFDSMRTCWHPMGGVTSWQSESPEGSRTYFEQWSVDSACATNIGVWKIHTFEKSDNGEYLTKTLHFQDNPRTAESYLPSFYVRDSR